MWQHPSHMQAGIQAALKSPNTPAHLRPHLAKRLGAMAGNAAAMPTAQRAAKNFATPTIPTKNPAPSFVNPFRKKF